MFLFSNKLTFKNICLHFRNNSAATYNNDDSGPSSE